ncbi:hypothetical protein PIIN_07198 [Serendipita indica DSM 11827]|uniref:Uncharacterized protein n=1 Tax=Serendipita indica (strain DSM 11827) TaxID=1109443 RepID=G4TPK0_SERID|nr:hypothetical protein PIIN_07198 [Serendipita indica DSM 11827]
MFGLIFQLSWFTAIVIYTNSLATLAHSSPPFTGCLSVPSTSLGWTVLVPPICNEAILILLTVIKTYPIVVQHGFHAPLYNLLLRDGFLYFLLIIIIQVTSLISVFRPSPLTMILVISFPALSVMGISCTRLLLRLQRALVSGDHDDSQTEFDRSEVTRNWPIVTFGGSGGSRMDPKAMNLGQMSPIRSQIPIVTLSYADDGVQREYRQYKPKAGPETVLGALELDLKPPG